MIRPPRIHHTNYCREDNLAEIARDCAAALHMSKGEAALFEFYAKCSDGFEPAANMIAEATDQSRRQVLRNRAALVGHGVIAANEREILIDWQRAKTFASLDPKLTRGAVIAPIRTERKPPMSVVEWHTLPMRVLIQRLNTMSEKEYDQLKQRLSKEVKQSEGVARPA